METSVPDVLENSLALVQHQLIKDGIIIAVDIQPSVLNVWVHPQQLEQVFINLLSNARYALNEKFKGKDKNKRLDLQISTFEAGKTYVRTSIKDYGIGIPAGIIDFVCNTFFSTKKIGEGTGLGLSISQGLVKKFNGFLHIESEPGQYTNISVDLPVYTGAQNDGQH
ncbi:MAG: HAMP domain-containing histidine kinase [Candidatus Brocadiia bacterium]|nr:MAG: HAMP domain-containing histidine kinase [Candidatus Brocadiia bacterium]